MAPGPGFEPGRPMVTDLAGLLHTSLGYPGAARWCCYGVALFMNCVNAQMVDLMRRNRGLPSVFRTIEIALPLDTTLVETALAFNEACQIVLNYGSQHGTFNKNALNKATCRQVRVALPNLPSALVQTARDEASEILRRTRCAPAAKKHLSVRYDKRTFKVARADVGMSQVSF